jgi:hypothetical protein
VQSAGSCFPLIEYSPRRLRTGTGIDPAHIHTIYRDPTNDYGERRIPDSTAR